MASNNDFTLTSPSTNTEEGRARLPRHCSQEGVGTKWNISPSLEWRNVPAKAKSLALVADDVDAVDPTGHVTPVNHWVVVNIPPSLTGLPEGFSGKEKAVGDEYGGIEEGVNDWKVKLWSGPKKPNYSDRFEFRLYALDHDMHFDDQVTKEKLLDAITGHVVGESVMIATF